jgi:hypothetical protein
MKPHEECKDTYKGPVCNCEHGYKRKYGDCVAHKVYIYSPNFERLVFSAIIIIPVPSLENNVDC